MNLETSQSLVIQYINIIYQVVNVHYVRCPHILSACQLFLADLYMARMFVKLIIGRITNLKYWEDVEMTYVDNHRFPPSIKNRLQYSI